MNTQRALFAAAVVVGLSVGAVRGNDFTPIVKSGNAVPGQGTTFTGVNLAGVDAATGTAFIGTFSVNSQTYSGLYRAQNGVITPLADRGTVGPAGETITSIIANGDYENGVVVFAANTSAGRALYRYTPGQGLTALVRQGDVLQGSESPVSSFYLRGVAGDLTNFAFGTVRQDNSHALYGTIDGGPPMQVADDKTRVPVAEMGDFIDFPEVHYRNSATAFVGRGMDPDAGTNQPETAGVFVSRLGNPIELVVAFNQPIPGAPEHMRFHEFERPRIMPDGRVGFAGGFIDETDPNPEAPHHMGVFIRNPDLTWKKYIDSEMILPGLHAEIHEFNQFSLETGVNFFGVNDIDGGSYLYYESAEGVFTHLIDTYQTLDGKALSRIRMLSDTAVGAQLYFRADFADGTSGVYAVTVPEPAAALGAAVLGVAALSGRRRSRLQPGN